MFESHRRTLCFSLVSATLACALLAGSTLAETPAASADPSAEPLDVPVSGDWFRRAQAEIRESEYHFDWSDEGGLEAPNRSQGLRSRVFEHGLEVESRTEGPELFRLTLSLGEVRRGDAAIVSETGILAADARRAEIRRPGGITEWFVNDDRGLEHGLDFAHPPIAGDGAIVLRFALGDGVLAYPDGDGGVRFDAIDGSPVATYDGLVVFDANGTTLPSVLRIVDGAIEIEFDDEGAAYPVTVDPLLASASWIKDGDQASAYYGFSVATAGDTNGDGYSDFIIGAYGYDNGQTNEGAAFFYYGTAGSPSLTADLTLEANQASARFGYVVSTAGDINNDGYDDVIVGADQYDNGQTNEGRVYVYHGGPSGPKLESKLEIDEAGAALGRALCWAGDVNNDGYADVAVGAPLADASATDEGRVFLYYGSSSGIGPSPSNAIQVGQAGARFGNALDAAGDVNGDGYGDLIVGSYLYDAPTTNEGRAWMWLGSSSGIGGTADWTKDGNQTSSYFGWDVSTAGDVNGDGYSDVIVGSYLYDSGQTDEGGAFVYLGNSGGLSTVSHRFYQGNQTSARMGWAVSTAGDVNGDGFADVMVSATLYDNGQGNEGRVYVYHGSASGLSSTADWTKESNVVSAEFGRALGAAGDVNGDGYSDVLIGSAVYDAGQTDEGQAWLYRGSADGLSTSATTRELNATSWYGFSVASAGDVNGDGFNDVIVGAHAYSGGGRAFVYHGGVNGPASSANWALTPSGSSDFGYSVASAGDVNGDGYSDVVVGDRRYTNTADEQGRALVYHGSSSGLSATAAFDVRGDPFFAHWGHSVASAGDVNCDGYTDILIGAPDYNGNARGAVFVYHGAAGGIDPFTVARRLDGTPTDNFGWSVASAGDVDGDGCSDILIGALNYDGGQSNEGRAYMYKGSESGIGPSSAWVYEANQAGAHLGWSVASAGDVNGDGYSDVIVGAPDYDSGSTDEGRVYIFHGKPGGLASSPARALDGNSAEAWMGLSVASAGDVDNDGYSDVVIGLPGWKNGQVEEGSARVYLGSASGIGAGSAWSVESNQTNAEYGHSVASAGDVNGDGFSDLLVGSYLYDNGTTDEGRLFVYYGGGRDGLDRIPRQQRYNSTSAPPIAMLGRSESTNRFRIRSRARSAAGRNRVRVQYEVRPFTTAYSGNYTHQSSELMSSSPGSDGTRVNYSSPISGLQSDTVYKWRLRFKAESPYFPRTPWMHQQGNGDKEWDVRTACVTSTWYRDGDGDGFGDPNQTLVECDQPAGYVSNASDCNDGNSSVNPNGTEVECDGLDNDCNGGTLDAPDVDNDGIDMCQVSDAGNTDGIGVDNCPTTSNPAQEDEDADSIGDACDVCLGDPVNDPDNDGYCDVVDCDSGDVGTWAIPGEVQNLRFSTKDTMTWFAEVSGGTMAVYDISRSNDPDFATPHCWADDVADLEADDVETPFPGTAKFYVVQAQNGCGRGTSGADSNGVDRGIEPCP